MKLHLGYLTFDHTQFDHLIPELAYREEIDIPPEMIPSECLFDENFFCKLISADLNDDIHEFIYRTYEDIMNDVIAEISLVPKSRYSLVEVQEIIEKEATDRILNETSNTHMFCVFADHENELYRFEYGLHSFLKKWVSDREEAEQGNIDAGSAIIRGTKQFMDEGLWQYGWIREGEIKKALMWFGLKGEKPEEGWILNLKTNQDTGRTWKDSWFDNEWMDRVSDDGGMLDFWMGMECGEYLPPMDEVLKTCPIAVDEQDDYESLTRKIITLLDSKKEY